MGGPVFPQSSAEKVFEAHPGADIQAVIDTAGDRTTLDSTLSAQTITKVQTVATITGAGTSWLSDGIQPDQLVQFNADTRFYKVKSVDSDTQMTLWEAYGGDTEISTSMDVRLYFLDWVTILLLPGQHNGPVAGSASLVVQPGQSFSSPDRYSTFLAEGDGTPGTVFENWGENRLLNLSIAPTNAFHAVDGFCSINSTVWGGALSVIDNCVLNIINAGAHSGGAPRLPLLNGGKSIVTRSQIYHDDGTLASFFGVGGGTVTKTIANTEVLVRHCDIDVVLGHSGPTNEAALPGDIYLNEVGTYKFQHVNMNMPDFAIDPISTSSTYVGAFWVDGALKLELSHVNSNVANTSAGGEMTACVGITAAATVDITHCDLEAAGSSGTAIHCNDAGATVNIRQSRLKGSTNSINNAAGTVNAMIADATDHGTVTTIGATTGVITAAET